MTQFQILNFLKIEWHPQKKTRNSFKKSENQTFEISKNEIYNFQILHHYQLFQPHILQGMLVNNQFLRQIQSSSKNSS